MSSVVDGRFSDLLIDDVLEKIFIYLDENDLEQCEAVCLKWRRIIHTRRISKKLFQRKICLSNMWKHYSKSAKIDFSSLSIHETISKFQELNRNWQTGKFKTTIHSLEFDDWNRYSDADDFQVLAGHCGYFYLDDDYILKQKREGPMLLKVLDRRTMKIQREFADISSFDIEITCVEIKDNIVMCGSYGYIKVYDANSGQEVNELEVPDGCKVRRISFGHCGLVAAVSGSFCDDIGCRLSIWRMNSPVDIVHLEILKLPLLDNTGYLTNMGMNEKYIAVFIHNNIPNGGQNSECYFFSTQTFNLERSVSVMDSRVRYKQGCLLVNNYVRHNIRVMDVSTGTCSRIIELRPLLKTTIVSIKANSRYLVMMDLLKTYEFKMSFEPIRKKGTNMLIFDLKAFLSADEQDVLLSHNVIPLNVLHFRMDENQVICCGELVNSYGRKMMVLDFSPDHSAASKKRKTC